MSMLACFIENASASHQMAYNHFIPMAHLKLIFPGLSNSNAICNLLLGHSALSSLMLHGEDQACEAVADLNKNRCESYKKISLRWRRFHQHRRAIVP